MRQEFYELVDAVRGLGLELTEKDPPKTVRIRGDASTFWLRLETLQRALEAFDSSGAAEEDGGVLEPRNDPVKLRAALDGVLRLFQMQGGNVQEAVDLVRDAMGLEEGGGKKKKKGYVTLPVFAPNALKKRARFKPRLSLLPERPSDVSLEDLRRMAFEVSQTEAMLGSTWRPPRQRDEASPEAPAPSLAPRS